MNCNNYNYNTPEAFLKVNQTLYNESKTVGNTMNFMLIPNQQPGTTT